MTRQALKLRDDLGDFLINVILRDDCERASRDFYTVLERVAKGANLTHTQYCDLEAAANSAMGDLADAAFITGVQVGRDPFPFFLEPTAGEGGDQ